MFVFIHSYRFKLEKLKSVRIPNEFEVLNSVLNENQMKTNALSVENFNYVME